VKPLAITIYVLVNSNFTRKRFNRSSPLFFPIISLHQTPS